MADNKINITVSANTKKNITVTSSQVSTEITASTDTGRFWAQTSKNWAISDVIVDNTDYSSKHFAQEAKTSAQNASNYEVSTRETYNSFLETSANAVTEIQGARDEAITNIETSRVKAIDSINSTKTTILNDIEFVADGEKQEIEDLIDSGKDELKEISATEQAELEEIKEGIINYAGIYYEDIADEDIDVDILEQGYVSDLELKEALDTKQDKGDYALKEEIPSLEGYVKNTDFAKSGSAGIINVAGSYGTTASASGYLRAVPKNLAEYNKSQDYLFVAKGTLENIKDDYIKRGVTKNSIELTEDEKASAKQWLGFADGTDIMQAIASIPQFKLSIVEALPTTGEKMTLYLVSKGTESPDVYDEYIWIEETSSFEFLGTTAVDLTDYVKKTDYASATQHGIVKVTSTYGLQVDARNGYLFGAEKTLDSYSGMAGYGVIAKGTLENVLTQYSKTVSLTQADYDALETVDENTLYLIEE